MKDFFKHNGLLILIIAVLLAAITFVASLFLGGRSDPLSGALSFITTPVKGAVTAMGDWVEGLYTSAYEIDRLKEEVERLRLELAQMSEKAREGAAASLENENFREILKLQQKRREFQFESATITARGTSNWDSTFTLSKGSIHGVAVDNCVVDPYGNLMGVITEVGLNSSTVSTLIDSSTQMGGLISRTSSAAILEGDFALMGQGRLKLTYLPEGADLIAGDVILTSGKGEVYPSGLVVGTVESVHIDESGMTRYAVIVPDTDLDSLKQVFVIKSFDIVE